VVALPQRGTHEAALALHILYPRRSLREARWQAAYPPLLVGGVLLCVVVGLAIVIAGRLSRPILELRRQLSRLVQGELVSVPLPRRNDELRDLIGSVNLLGSQLEESRRAIERAERLSLLGQLSGGLAHQLRNSVTGARIAVELHQRHCCEIDRESLSVALRQLALTESYLQRFFTLGQPMAPRRGRCDLRRAVEEVAALVRPACDHRNVAFEFRHDALDRLELRADADQVRQLIVNLALNAIEAAGEGGWVRIEAIGSADSAVMRVVDSGPGPAAHLVERLFEPFATGKREGIGLGLAECKRIAESHGGTIRYVDQGCTCFEVILPHAPPGEAVEKQPVAVVQAAS
jgi:signal transduction histidine kinase